MSATQDAALTRATARQPKTRKGRKILKQREPQVVEDAKTALMIRGNKSSHDVTTLLRDLYSIRAPLGMLYTRKHAEHPFEDIGGLEHMCKKFDHSLFAFGSSSKKRPFRLILGRMFDNKLLDMQEYGIDEFKSISSFGARRREALAGSKPMVIFQGAAFENDERVKRTKSLLLDMFNGPKADKVLLQGLEQVIVCSCLEGEPNGPSAIPKDEKDGPKVSVARYFVKLSKSGSRLPRVELEEIGPRMRLTLDRTREPERERWKQSIKVAKGEKPKKVKNITFDREQRKKRGQIHLGTQDFDQIHTVHHSKKNQKKLRADLAANKEGGTGDGNTA